MMMAMRTTKQAARVLRRDFSARVGSGGVAGPKITGAVRLYKDVDVAEIKADDGATTYAVQLDGRTVKTPARTPVRLPNKQLARIVAHEWDAQEKTIRPATMPMMSLASTALDLGATSTRKELVDEMMHYLHTDTVCYMVTDDQQEKLAALQNKKWKPLRDWFEETFATDGAKVDVSYGTIDGLTHDRQLVDNVRSELEKLSDYELVAMRCLTKECKSLITALALHKRHVTAKEAMDLCRLEEEYQISRWGLVEGGHDLDRVNCTVNLSSASLLLWLLRNHA
ncbi:TPA: hypothetical protein N0F65_008611 [Lagenidium giganteum]|uniref:ATP synthase mitochondrial F1 complex assembly factor 2 n=1 Tax=Lagenidium giganteum TaxID=4803 RepID=A0AAV2Z2T1_9STRA|nr:TPA: hypothetical protein N0F65_008611 [Lagenidium giganteum]